MDLKSTILIFRKCAADDPNSGPAEGPDQHDQSQRERQPVVFEAAHVADSESGGLDLVPDG